MTETAPTDTLIPPAEIDLTFVPQRFDDVVEATVGDDILLFRGGQPLVLNPTASIIWQCLDGEVSLGELSTELSEEMGADPAAVRADVLGFVRSLGEAGLLVGVGLTYDLDDLPDFPGTEPAQVVAVGTEFEPFTLPDLDGTERSLTDWRGERILLVNWSPGCGYCTMIAPSLAEVQPALTERGVSYLFVTDGDADANRAVLDGAGIDAPVLLKDDHPDPFTGFGTPLAYLLDADGVVATPVGWGADQVLTLVEEVSGVTLSANPFAPVAPVAPEAESEPEPDLVDVPVDAPPLAPTVKYLPAPGGT